MIVVASLLAGLVLLEAGFRGFLALRGRSWDPQRAREEVEEVRRRNRPFVPAGDRTLPRVVDSDARRQPVLHPYLAWETRGDARVIESLLDYATSPERARNFDVIVVGGSVAAGFATPGLGAGPLAAGLAGDPRLKGRVPNVINLGRGGYKQPQQAILLVWLLSLGVRPDAVVNIDGFNEVALGRENLPLDVHPLFPAVSLWGYAASTTVADGEAVDLAYALRRQQREVEERCETMLGLGLEASALLETLCLSRLHALQAECVRTRDALASRTQAIAGSAVRGPPHHGGPAEALQKSVRGWFEASLVMQQACQARGIAYLHVLQPTLHDEGSKPLTEAEIRGAAAPEAWVQGAKEGYPLLRSAGTRLGALGVAFLDESGLFRGVEERLYYDSCHFEEAGHRLLAAEISKGLLEALAGSR